MVHYFPEKWSITSRKMVHFFPENGPLLPGKWSITSRKIVICFRELSISSTPGRNGQFLPPPEEIDHFFQATRHTRISLAFQYCSNGPGRWCSDQGDTADRVHPPEVPQWHPGHQSKSMVSIQECCWGEHLVDVEGGCAMKAALQT